MTVTERCDPDFLECTGPSGGGTAIFEEDFEGFLELILLKVGIILISVVQVQNGLSIVLVVISILVFLRLAQVMPKQMFG